MRNVSMVDIGDRIEFAELLNVNGSARLFFPLCAALEESDKWSLHAAVEIEWQSEAISNHPSGL